MAWRKKEFPTPAPLHSTVSGFVYLYANWWDIFAPLLYLAIFDLYSKFNIWMGRGAEPVGYHT